MASILIIDDRPINRDYLATLLSYGGHTIFEAADGAIALEIARSQRLDLIITDLKMPVMNGFEFTRLLRQEATGANTPVIFYTATYLQGEARAMAKGCNVTQVLMKPSGPEEILAAVANCLGQPMSLPPEAESARLQLKSHQALVEQPFALKLADLIDLTAQLVNERDPALLLQKFCQGARYILGGKVAAILLLGSPSPVVSSGSDLPLQPVAVDLTAPDGLLSQVLSDRHTLRVRDRLDSLTSLGLGLEETAIGSFLGAPIIVADQLYGLLYFAGKYAGPEFDEQDESMALTMATQLAITYHNARLVTEIRAAEIKYRTLVEQIPAVTFVSAPGDPWRMLYVSPRIEELLGFPCSDWTQSPARWQSQVHPDDLARLQRSFTNCTTAGATFWEEYRMLNRDGGLVWVLQRAVVTEDEMGCCLSKGYLVDITDRKAAEAALHEADERHRFLVDSVPQIIWTARPDGSMEYFNRRWFEYSGIAFDHDKDSGWRSMVHPDDLQDCLNGWTRSLETGIEYERETRIKRGADGDFRWHLVRAVPRRDEHGGILQWAGTCTDIDDQKSGEEKIRQMNAELEQRVADRTGALEQVNAQVVKRTREVELANKELEAFSYSISHDLRAPLRALDGFSRILLTDYASVLPAEGIEYLQDVRNSAVQMGHLVDDLLAFSHLGRESFKRQQLSPTALVRTCLTEIQRGREDRPLDFAVENLPDCWADPALLKQVWINLISNALKYAGKRALPEIRIGACRDDESGRSAYFIKDNGVGFDMRYAHKLFGVFQRLHRAEDYEGTGVGLAIVQRIVQRHGGRIWAKAAPDAGATFFFTLEEGIAYD